MCFDSCYDNILESVCACMKQYKEDKNKQTTNSIKDR